MWYELNNVLLELDVFAVLSSMLKSAAYFNFWWFVMIIHCMSFYQQVCYLLVIIVLCDLVTLSALNATEADIDIEGFVHHSVHSVPKKLKLDIDSGEILPALWKMQVYF